MTLRATIVLDHEGRRFRLIPEDEFLRLESTVDDAVPRDSTEINQSPMTSNAVKLKTAREAKGITQSQLANATGMTQTSISRIEKGHHTPRARNLRLLMEAIENFEPTHD